MAVCTLSKSKVAILERIANAHPAPLAEPLSKTGEALGLSSRSTVFRHLRKLQQDGLITVDGEAGCSYQKITLTPQGAAEIGRVL